MGLTSTGLLNEWRNGVESIFLKKKKDVVEAEVFYRFSDSSYYDDPIPIRCVPDDDEVVVEGEIFHSGDTITTSSDPVGDVVFLDGTQRSDIRDAMFMFLQQMLNSLDNCKDWDRALGIIVDTIDFTKNYNHKNLGLTEAVRSEGKEIFLEMNKLLCRVPNELCTESINGFALLDNRTIKQRLVKKISGETYFNKIKILSSFHSLLRNNASLFRFVVDHSVDGTKPQSIVARDMSELYDEVKDLIFLHTPVIEFKSREQINILRGNIGKIAEYKYMPMVSFTDAEEPEEELFPFDLFYFDFLEHSTSLFNDKIIVKKSKGKISKDPGFTLPEKAKPADIIRALLSKMILFNERYKDDSMDLKIWLYCLFIDVDKFSLNHILNASNRKKKSI